MRKPSKIVPTHVNRGSIALISIAALLAQSACRNGDSKANGGASRDSVSAVAGIGSGGRGFATQETPAPASESAVADQAMGAVAAAPSAPFAGKAVSRDASTNTAATRGDLSLGVPIPGIDVTGAMLVRHGQASIEIRDMDKALESMRQAASQHGGFVANTALRGGRDEQRSATLELRVPSDKFEGLLSALSALGKLESVTATAEDVAEEYVDLGARAANARKVEARLIEMLATRTGKLSDVLTVEQELARVRMEAERYDARIRWLERRASLSSLDITIHEPIPLLEQQRGPGPMAQALAEAWSRMVGVAAWCIAALGVLVPLGVLLGVGIAVARRFWRSGPRKGDTATEVHG
jgi:Domain of unknown function (DUF4349)